MKRDTEAQAQAQGTGNTGTRRRRIGALLLFAALALLAPLAVYLYQHRPDLYDPTRADLVEAERELEIYSEDMVELVDKHREGSVALKATIRRLQEAAASDPDDLAEIDAIELAIEQLEDPVHAGKLSAGQLRDRYNELVARVQRLIEKRGGEPQPRPE